MKIGFILEHFYPHVGGAETITLGYAKELVKQGHEVSVFTSYSGKGEKEFTIDGVNVYAFLWKSRFGHPVPKITDIEDRIKSCNLVYTTTYTAAPHALKLASKYSIPCLITVFEVLGRKWFWVEKNYIKALVFMLYEKYVISRPYDYYHSISKATTTDLINAGIDPKKINTVYPGIDDYFSKNTNTPNIRKNKKYKFFLYFGRPGKTKGIFVLLEAIKMLDRNLDKNYSFRFILSNDPITERVRFIKLVEYYGLNERIKIMDGISRDKISELIKHIREAFAVIVPSITEGFGYSAVETCYLGTPIIVSDGGSLPEVVFGKVLTFKNRNSMDLSKKIILATKGEFKKIDSKKFDWTYSTKELLSILKK